MKKVLKMLLLVVCSFVVWTASAVLAHAEIQDWQPDSDIILMSQSVKNISIEARRQFEVIYSVLNIKNITLGKWPFYLPMQDIDVVRESWGSPAQFAHIKKGVCEDDKIVYDKVYEIFLLRPSLFRLYKSVTMAGEVLDRPTLKLGKLGSIVWLLRRHGIRWAVSLGILVFLGAGFVNAVCTLPEVMISSMVQDQKNVKPPARVTKTDVVTDPDGTVRLPVPIKMDDDKITGFVKGGVITPRGVLRKDDHITYEGEKDYVAGVDVVKGILYLGSGKKVQK